MSLSTSSASIEQLEAQLCAHAGRPAFDMDDTEELPQLAGFPPLHAALAWLNDTVTPLWRAADAAALVHQRRHQLLARIAIATGAGAILIALVQLALKQSWPEWLSAAGSVEFGLMLAGVLAVVVGHSAKSDRKWLGYRHRAERLRMLKFQSLARPELWSGREADWQQWVNARIAALPAPHDLEEITRWSRRDTPEWSRLEATTFAVSAPTQQALATYYRHKRLLNQADYFLRKGREASASWGLRLRHYRVGLFVASMACVVIHFAADFTAEHLVPGTAHEAIRSLEIVSVWGIAIAAALPVIGIGLRAWSAAFELGRKACAFAAKHTAMTRAAARLEALDEPLPTTLSHLLHDELFLEQEHREWLRLLLEAEWFL